MDNCQYLRKEVFNLTYIIKTKYLMNKQYLILKCYDSDILDYKYKLNIHIGSNIDGYKEFFHNISIYDVENMWDILMNDFKFDENTNLWVVSLMEAIVDSISIASVEQMKTACQDGNNIYNNNELRELRDFLQNLNL